MLYSSGTTGRPKGVQKQLPLTPLGDMSAAPVVIASRMALSGAGPRGRVPVARPALPLGSSRLLDVDAPSGCGGRRHGALRSRAMPGVDRRTPCDTCAVRPDDVHAASCACPPEERAKLRHLEPQVRGACRRPVSCRGQDARCSNGGVRSSTSTTREPRTSGSTWITRRGVVGAPGLGRKAHRTGAHRRPRRL